MKQLLDLNQEFIIEARFKEKYNQEKKETDWVDKSQLIANGNNLVQSVFVLARMPDDNGHYSSHYSKIYIDKHDILKLAEKIKEIESVELTGMIGDDLLF